MSFVLSRHSQAYSLGTLGSPAHPAVTKMRRVFTTIPGFAGRRPFGAFACMNGLSPWSSQVDAEKVLRQSKVKPRRLLAGYRFVEHNVAAAPEGRGQPTTQDMRRLVVPCPTGQWFADVDEQGLRALVEVETREGGAESGASVVVTQVDEELFERATRPDLGEHTLLVWNLPPGFQEYGLRRLFRKYDWGLTGLEAEFCPSTPGDAGKALSSVAIVRLASAEEARRAVRQACEITNDLGVDLRGHEIRFQVLR